MDKLTEQRNTLYAQADELVKKAETEGRAFTDEEKGTYDATMTELRALDEQLNRAEEVRKLALHKPDSEPPADSREQAEYRAFDAFLRGNKETRANITYGANGAVIPDTIMNKVIDRVVEISPLFAAATKYAVIGDITIPKIDRSAGADDITVAFSAEFSSLTAHGIAFSSVNLSGHLAAALVLISKQLINNSAIDVVDIVVQKMAEKIAVFVENFLLNGDSSIQNSGIAGSIDSGNIKTVASVSALTADDLIDVQDTIPDAYQGGAFWIMHSTLRNRIRKLKDGQQNYLLVPDFQRGSGYTLLGKPVYVTDNLPTAAAAASGDTVLYYGDFSGLAVKTGESAEIQMLLEKYAEQHAVGLNAWFELDAKIENTQKIAALALS